MAIPPATAYETDVNTLRERINYLRGDNESLRERVATLESIAYSDDGAGGDGMRLFLENVAMKQRVAELLAYNQTRTDELAASVAQAAAMKVELQGLRARDQRFSLREPTALRSQLAAAQEQVAALKVENHDLANKLTIAWNKPTGMVLVGWLDGRTRFFSVGDPMYRDRHDGMREVFAAGEKV